MAASGVEKIRSWQEVKIVKLNLIEPLCSGDIGLVFMLTDSVGPLVAPSWGPPSCFGQRLFLEVSTVIIIIITYQLSGMEV